ncbi:MAG: hypothetical protein KBS85_02495 [Lachnospiraceae bacterium]|nr:hypothetical protein [Candidatus Merdinaster equi]
MSAKTDCCGETRLMKCGMNATCIKYENANNMDVQFEDGTIIKKKSKDSFYKGAIDNPNVSRSSCLGEKRVMNNGQFATCIAYRKYNDLDVCFEDGTIVCNLAKTNFQRGAVANPNFDANSCLGKELLMNNGQMAECIADHGSMNIDVKFEDGTVVLQRRRTAFINGEIANPNKVNRSFPELLVFDVIKYYFPDAKRSYRPKWLYNSQTRKRMEIDIWIPSLRVGIEYDGGFWHKEESERSKAKYEIIKESEKINILYTIIENGAISHESEKHKNFNLTCDSTKISDLLNELSPILVNILSDCGICDPYIDFSEEKLAEIRKNNVDEVLGMTVIMKCGLKATCIQFRTVHDIDIQFEDGVIVQHKQKSSFLMGYIAHPKINSKTVQASCLGEERMMKCGMKAKCVRFIDSGNIDVEFEDGTIIRGRQKDAFLRGTIGHPSINVRTNKASCLGVRVKMNNGQYAECIRYKNSRDIDIQFEDGTIVENKAKSSFLDGSIKNPRSTVFSCLGERRKMNNGEYATCIKYRGTHDIDVQFDDGTIVLHRTKQAFYSGKTRKNMGESCLGVKKEMQSGLIATCVAYRNSLDIDVEFEDGTIVFHRTKHNFLRGHVDNPNNKGNRYETRKKSCVGEKRMMNCGIMATCIQYRNAHDIDVRFEDGVIVEHRQRVQFSKGCIAHPYRNKK